MITVWEAVFMGFAGYQAMQTVKYVVGLALIIMGKYEAVAWWDREIIR